MKRDKISGRLLALALTLGMALSLAPSLAVPARAAGAESNRPQIIISSNRYVSTPEDDAVKDNELKAKLITRFWAYQIFRGEIDEEDYVENRDINKLNGIETEGSPVKAIQWGASIQEDKQQDLLDALGADKTPARDLGITFELMLEAGKTYLSEDYLANYTSVYNNTSYWVPETEGGKGEIGGELTTAGRAALEEAFNKDLETLTIGQLFTAAYEKNKATIQVYGARTASMIIADFTPASGNVALAQAFYAIVFDRDTSGYKYLKNSGGEAEFAPPEGNNTDNKYEGAYAVSRWNSEYKCWYIGTMDDSRKIRTLPDGYYMIRDAYSEAYDEDKDNPGKASAAYMAGVYGYGTIDPKAEAPSVNKTIANASANGTSRELGETITFTLEGSLPENYFTAYKGYPYIFEDTMDPGLTYGNIIRVYVKVPDANGRFGYLGAKYDYYVVDQYSGPETGNQGKGYRLTTPDMSNDNTLTISFPNLQNVKGKKVVDENLWTTEGTDPDLIPVNNRSEVYVVYTATLNEGANITDITASNTGNRNTVVLRYANEPLWDPAALHKGGSWDENWDEAPKGGVTDTVYLYDFGVQLTVYGKKDDGGAETPTTGPNTGETEERKPLAGAGFALKKSEYDYASNKAKDYYAILHQVKETGSGPNTPDTYYLAGWVSEDDLYTYLAGDTLTRITRSWGESLNPGEEIGGFTVPAGDGYYAAVKTDDNGVVRIVGLDSGSTYALEEVITPEGWAAVDNISVSFAAAHNPSTGMLTGLTAEADGAAYEEDSGKILSDGNFQNGYSELVVRLIIEQEPADEIVDTGGMGNTLFYIGGGALLAGAALLLIIMNVKKPERRDR